jgi:hypothetical protein
VIDEIYGIIRSVQYKWLQWTGSEFGIGIKENRTEFRLGSLIQNGHLEELEGDHAALIWLLKEYAVRLTRT